METGDEAVLNIEMDEIKTESDDKNSENGDTRSIDGRKTRSSISPETEKTDDDFQGYDTRSEVASSIDSDSEDNKSSKSSFNKRKQQQQKRRHSESGVRSRDRRNGTSNVGSSTSTPAPLKRNSAEYLSQLNYLFRNARFFVIKSNNAENVALSKSRGVWATLPQNQIKLCEAFNQSDNVILIFSVKESGKFSGFARLASTVDRTLPAVPWVVSAELNSHLLRGTFRIDWVCKNDLPFVFTTSLFNSWNFNKPVKIARDGQEVEPYVAEKLCRMFPQDKRIDIAPILRASKETSANRKSGRVRTESSGMPAPNHHAKGLFTAKYRVGAPASMVAPPHIRHVRDGRIVKAAPPQRTIIHHMGGAGLTSSRRGGVGGGGGNRASAAQFQSYMKRFVPAGATVPPFRPPLPLPPAAFMDASGLRGADGAPPLPLHLPLMPPLPPPPMGPPGSHPSRTGRFYDPMAAAAAAAAVASLSSRYGNPKSGSKHHPSAALSSSAPLPLLPTTKRMYERTMEEFLRKNGVDSSRIKEYYREKNGGGGGSAESRRDRERNRSSGGGSRRTSLSHSQRYRDRR